MTLTLAEKTLLLLYGLDGQEPAYASPEQVKERAAWAGMRSRVIGALLMDALLQGQLELKRPALFVQCRRCYQLLVLLMLSLFLAALVGLSGFYAVGALSFSTVAAAVIAFCILWYAAFLLLGHQISGRLVINETTTQDEGLTLILQRMRQVGQAKSCLTYFRRLARFQGLAAWLEKVQAHFVEDGYVVATDRPASIPGESVRLYQMNATYPACQELLTRLRAFLLEGTGSDQYIAALAILLSPRVLSRNQHSWAWYRLCTWFTPDEYLVLQARLKAITAQQDQALRAQLGATTYRGLLTIRTLLPD